MNMLSPLSWVYSKLIDIRNRCYDSGAFSNRDFPVVVVSVGNLTMGGTGKTPLICAFVDWALKEKIKVAVVSRGYGGEIRDVAKVANVNPSPKVFGDEPVMIAERFPSVPVYVGPRRVRVVEQLIKDFPDTELVLADDAFQHRELARDVDIVVMDASESPSGYAVIPAGRGRERIEGLKRAHFVVLTKVNLVPEAKKEQAIELIESVVGDEIPIVEAEYYVNELKPIEGGASIEVISNEPVLAVSAIGNPSAFLQILKQKFDVRDHMVFRDHHEFSDSDVAKIRARASELKVKRVIVTEKDAIKLKAFAQLAGLAWVTVLKPKLGLKARQLFEVILNHVR